MPGSTPKLEKIIAQSQALDKQVTDSLGNSTGVPIDELRIIAALHRSHLELLRNPKELATRGESIALAQVGQRALQNKLSELLGDLTLPAQNSMTVTEQGSSTHAIPSSRPVTVAEAAQSQKLWHRIAHKFSCLREYINQTFQKCREWLPRSEPRVAEAGHTRPLVSQRRSLNCKIAG
jgi:hypothetical protein